MLCGISTEQCYTMKRDRWHLPSNEVQNLKLNKYDTATHPQRRVDN